MQSLAARWLFFLGILEEVNCLTFSSDGKSLVSGSDDKTVKLWDMQTGGVVKTFYGHTKRVWSVSISADCTRIASGSEDNTTCLWDIQTGECFCTIKQQGTVHHVSFSPTSSAYHLHIWKQSLAVGC
jgi:WD40 repeat protein